MKKISVIMGIYNCADTLGEAIQSILNQTYTNWELIMCDDASADETYMVAKKYCEDFPDKMVLLKNEKNKGLNYTLNKCLEVATGDYIARMDGDDLCSPERFEEEIAVLDDEPEVSIVSTGMEYFDQEGIWGSVLLPKYPKIKEIVKGVPHCHAPCMVRKEAYDAVEGYTVAKNLLRVEDYHLWIKMYSLGFRGKNIQKPLYQMRDDRNAYNRRKFRFRINETYVKLLAVKKLQLPIWYSIYAMRPIIVGLCPKVIYDYFHKKKRV